MEKIAMIVFSHYPPDPRVRREAEALERAGMSVDVICLRGEGESKVERIGQVTAYRVLRTANKENLPAYVWQTSKFIVAAWFAFFRLSLKNKYGLLQVHNMPDHLVFIGFWQKIFGLPIILDLHDLTVELFESRWKSKMIRVLLPLVHVVENISCRFSNHLITTSNGFYDCLVRRGIPADKITLVLNSADNTIFKRSELSRKNTEGTCRIFYHGTVKERFGIHVAVEAMALIRKELPNATLTIHGGGDPNYYVELEEKIAAFELEDHVFLKGYRPLEKIVDLINESDIGIVPYMSDSFMDIALSTKSFEYVALGLPVAASRLPSCMSIFDNDCVEYFEPGNAQDMADQILSLSRDPERQKTNAENALRAYEKISWPIMEKRYLDLVKKMARE